MGKITRVFLRNNMRQTGVWGIHIFIAIIFLGAGLPFYVHAAVESPEKNPLCWSKEACTEQYKMAGWCNNKETSCEGKVQWLQGEPAECGSWGACVPPGKAQLSIAFSGKTEVKDLGEYIKLIYSYLVGIAGVIAAVLIVKGGFEYIIAGGASERVSAAKKSIGSAVFGLLLVLASYTLFNTVNPDLVHLRLPNVYMVRKIVLGADWCKDATLGKDSSGKEQQFALEKDGPDAKIKFDKDNTACGEKFLIPDGAGKTCVGQVCKSTKDVPNVCEEYYKDSKKAYVCIEGVLSGEVTSTSVPFPYIDNNLSLIGVCNEDGKEIVIGTIDIRNDSSGKKSQHYVFNIKPDEIKSKMEKECAKGVKGFFLGAEVNDVGGGYTGAGCDDWFAIGRSGSMCNINLSKVLLGHAPKNNIAWSCANLSFSASSKPPYNAALIPDSNLIPMDELLKGTSCNISLDREEFPALINSVKTYLLPVYTCDVPDPTSCLKYQ